MLVSMLLVSEAALALTPLCGDLNPRRSAEAILSEVGLEKIQFILNPVLPLCHFFGSLARLRLG